MTLLLVVPELDSSPKRRLPVGDAYQALATLFVGGDWLGDKPAWICSGMIDLG